VEEWRKRNRSLQALEKGFAAGAVRHFGQVALPVVHLKHIAAERANSARVKSVNDHAGFLRSFNRRIDIGAEWVTAEAIDSIGHKQHFAARSRNGPALEQIHE